MPAGDRSGTRRQTALTVLAAPAGVAGGTEAGSRGGIAAGVVRTLRTYLLAAQSPATVRASWSTGRERGHTSIGITAQALGGNVYFLVQGNGSPSSFVSVLRAKHRLLFGNTWLLTGTTLLCLFYKQRVSPG